AFPVTVRLREKDTRSTRRADRAPGRGGAGEGLAWRQGPTDRLILQSSPGSGEAGGEVLLPLCGLRSQFFVCLMPNSCAASSRRRPSSSSRGLVFFIQATAC